MMHVLAIDASPTGPGRTAAVLGAVLAGAAEGGVRTSSFSLGGGGDDIDRAVQAMGEADAFVIGSPVYRGSYAAPLKALFDRLPRGMWGETEAPITARAVAIVLTGATWHHYLGLDDLRNVLAGFFAAHVLSPGLYVPADGFDDAREPKPDVARLAHAQGRALVELAGAVSTSSMLAAVRPQA